MKFVQLIIVAILATKNNLYAAEAGMPQLDPKYWASQAFWLILVFSFLYLIISKFFLPKIKNNLDARENKIKQDLEEANNLKNLAEKKQEEYEIIIENSKKEILKIVLESKKKLEKDIQNKKKVIEKDIETELNKAQEEIIEFKKKSVNNICKISEDMVSNIIQDIAGDSMNESSIKAAVNEISKNNMDKYL